MKIFKYSMFNWAFKKELMITLNIKLWYICILVYISQVSRFVVLWSSVVNNFCKELWYLNDDSE